MKFSLTLIQKLFLIFFLKLIVGNSIFLFIDKIFGSIILLAAIFTFIWIFKLRCSSHSLHYKLVAQLHLIIGCLMIIGAVSIIYSSGTLLDIRVGIKSTIASILLYKSGRQFLKDNN
ncbi:MAG: hypothetical protein ACMXYB_01960 [Candidatus Woesearchaeota archaeon]